MNTNQKVSLSVALWLTIVALSIPKALTADGKERVHFVVVFSIFAAFNLFLALPKQKDQ